MLATNVSRDKNNDGDISTASVVVSDVAGALDPSKLNNKQSFTATDIGRLLNGTGAKYPSTCQSYFCVPLATVLITMICFAITVAGSFLTSRWKKIRDLILTSSAPNLVHTKITWKIKRNEKDWSRFLFIAVTLGMLTHLDHVSPEKQRKKERKKSHGPSKDLIKSSFSGADLNVNINDQLHMDSTYHNIFDPQDRRLALQGTGSIPFLLSDGDDCTIDGMCFISQNYPLAEYGGNNKCEITVLQNGTLITSKFDTERNYDKLTVEKSNGVVLGPYSGTLGPDKVVVNSGDVITFTSDGGVQKRGFEICMVNTICTNGECIHTNGLTKNSDACQCGTAVCTGTSGHYCVESLNTCQLGPPCTNTDGSALNIEVCMCGERACTEAVGLYCRDQNVCSKSSGSYFTKQTESNCKQLPGGVSVRDPLSCKFGADSVGAVGEFVYKNAVNPDDNTPQFPLGCVYTHSETYFTRSSHDVYDIYPEVNCSLSHSCICFVAPNCIQNNGTTENQGPCNCGNTPCTGKETTGLYCQLLLNTCGFFPSCTNIDGTSVNSAGNCSCGSTTCTSKTGFFCRASLNSCSKYDSIYYRVAQGNDTCTSMPGRGNIDDISSCNNAALALGWISHASKNYAASDPFGPFTEKNSGSSSEHTSGCSLNFGKNQLLLNHDMLSKVGCQHSGNCACAIAPSCSKFHGAILNNDPCLCNSKVCPESSYCNRGFDRCSLLVACQNEHGAIINSNNCSCGLSDCISTTGLYCYADGSRCESTAIPSCSNAQGITINTGTSCACGSHDCTEFTGMFCRSTLSSCSKNSDYYFVAILQGMCTDTAERNVVKDVKSCVHGSLHVGMWDPGDLLPPSWYGTASWYWYENIYRYRSYGNSKPPGCYAEESGKIYYNSDISSEGSANADARSLCFVAPNCIQNNGTTENQGPCNCGNTPCTGKETTGLYCQLLLNTCGFFPSCTNIDGTSVNSAGNCSCGSTTCTSKTGFFCRASLNSCSKYDSIYFVGVKEKTCAAVILRGHLTNSNICLFGAIALGWTSGVTDVKKSSSSYGPKGCYRDANLNLNSKFDSDEECSTGEGCVCMVAPICTHQTGLKTNKMPCLCGESACFAGSFCSSKYNSCSTAKSCLFQNGLMINPNTNCACGMSLCTNSTGFVCFAAANFCGKVPTYISVSTATCQHFDLVDVREDKCLGAAYKAGWWSNIASPPQLFASDESWYPFGCFGGPSDSFLFYNRNQQSTKSCDYYPCICNAFPDCLNTLGRVRNEKECKCGTTACHGTLAELGLYCNAAANECSSTAICEYSSGNIANINVEKCACGAAECGLSSGFFCQQKANTCSKFPLCSNTNGSAITSNAPCACGTSDCLATGYCQQSTSKCAYTKCAFSNVIFSETPSLIFPGTDLLANSICSMKLNAIVTGAATTVTIKGTIESDSSSLAVIDGSTCIPDATTLNCRLFTVKLGATLDLENVQLKGGSVCSDLITCGYFQGNDLSGPREKHGGLIAVMNPGSKLLIRNSIIGESGNILSKSAINGGGISVTNLAHAEISHSTIVGNFASDAGGGIFVFGSSATLLSCKIGGNKAMTGGGLFAAISDEYGSSKLILKESIVTMNEAIEPLGGGSQRGPITGRYGSSMNNFLFSCGGGMTIYGKSFAEIYNSSISENAAKKGAGIQISKGGQLLMENSTVKKNGCINCQVNMKAGSKGGGINSADSGGLNIDMNELIFNGGLNSFEGNIAYAGNNIFHADAKVSFDMCPKGLFSINPPPASRDADFIGCPDFCPRGSYAGELYITNPESAECPHICPPGSYCPTGSTEVIPCPGGKYGTNFGEFLPAACFSCLPGKYTNGIFPASECMDCPTGWYQNEKSQPFCLPCSPGAFASSLGSFECENCPSGYLQSQPKKSLCEEVDAGKVVADGGSAMIQVPLGSKICDEEEAGDRCEESAQFEACTAGKYGVAPIPTNRCYDCEAGKSSYQGSTKCQAWYAV